jgi:hypothetical protein
MADVPAPILRDIYFIWFYVTMTRLDDIDKVNPDDPNDPRVPVETIISDLAALDQGAIAMNETNIATVKTFYAGILANKGFRSVRGVLRSHDVLDGIWTVDPPHPEILELQSVFIPPEI